MGLALPPILPRHLYFFFHNLSCLGFLRIGHHRSHLVCTHDRVALDEGRLTWSIWASSNRGIDHDGKRVWLRLYSSLPTLASLLCVVGVSSVLSSPMNREGR